ncbi:uncharacterized protein LOC131947576 [Physella acuta]|uniref:uncharacterized protein LOC131947576 n=1 Tax=Physella acuta TaxID=109671 RepID=UPI0027DD82FA|nr:uncharacterized protein LOC131947576 [Physella acuta]
MAQRDPTEVDKFLSSIWQQTDRKTSQKQSDTLVPRISNVSKSIQPEKIPVVAPGQHPKNTLTAVLKGKTEKRMDEIIIEDLISQKWPKRPLNVGPPKITENMISQIMETLAEEDSNVTILKVEKGDKSGNSIIGANDHASIQINITEVDETTGRMTGSYKTYAICGAIRRMGESDDSLITLAKQHGIITKNF